jgi:hypothetical protein
VVKTYPPFHDGIVVAKIAAILFLRCTIRNKDGERHRYYIIVENRHLTSGKVAQCTVVYLGQINDSQEAAWRKMLEVCD